MKVDHMTNSILEQKKPESHEQKASYGFGWQFGRQLHKNRFEGLDIEFVIQAMRQCFAGEPSVLSDDEVNEAFDLLKEKRMRLEAERKEKYQLLSQTFLEANAKREGVKVTDSGLQYEILEAGVGEIPSGNARLRIHYHGSFIDGQVFDSSITRNEPAEFTLDQVIAGWTEALSMMPVGSKWRIVVPPQLAYGEAGYPPAIPPNAALVFEVHLMAII
jgi:FKBP-type peptidyl-prolyl cis-trans isomerase FklB